MIPLLALLILADTGQKPTPSWTVTNSVLLAGMVASQVVDWSMTVDARRRGNYEETNLALGKRPSVGRLNTYSALMLLASVGIARVLKNPWRNIWMAGITGLELGRDWHSSHIGLRLNFDI